jgi:hypothetical protein
VAVKGIIYRDPMDSILTPLNSMIGPFN